MGGSVPPTCVKCREPLLTANARFCFNCGALQQQMRTCIVCGAPMVAGAQHCAYCGTNQSNTVVCVNPQCRKLILPTMKFCPFCGTPKAEGTASSYQVPQSQGHPSYSPITHLGGLPSASDIYNQGYHRIEPQMASMPYSLGSQEQPQVKQLSILQWGVL